MSEVEINLCSVLLKEHFGEIVQKVGISLMEHGCLPLRMIIDKTKLPLEKIKKSLCVLLQHNLIETQMNKRNFLEYSIDNSKVLHLLRYPKFIYCAKTLYGDIAELLIEELLDNGQMTMSSVILKVLERLSEATERDCGSVEAVKVKEIFINLANTRFIQRFLGFCSQEQKVSSKQSYTDLEKALYSIPEINLGLLLVKREPNEDDEPVSKKQKIENEQPDKKIYWRVNFDRFHQYLRDQLIISSVENAFDKKASDVVRTICRLAETRSKPWAPVTNPVSRHEILNELIKNSNMNLEELDPYLAVLTDGLNPVLTKCDDKGDGMYIINVMSILQSLAESTVISIVKDRFGSKCCRIFRLILLKKYIEQKQIEDLAMIPSKDAKECTYSMLQENFISSHEISKTPDHAPSRTFYLFHVNLNQLSRMLLDYCYKATYNAVSRREFENREHKRLLEKKQRVDAIVSSLQQSGAVEQIQEVEEVITPPEKAQLEKVKYITDKLEKTEIQLDDTVFVLTMFLFYSQSK